MGTVRSQAWGHYPFKPEPWPEVAAFFQHLNEVGLNLHHLSAITASVIESGVSTELAACTSMHDLIVVPLPLIDPPYGVVAVRAPGSLDPPSDGAVRIEHLSVTGHNDRIERPIPDAVPLFWRFMIEKFGVSPARSEER